MPFLVSSRGYGILWDNTSYTHFGDQRPFTEIPAKDLFDADGRAGGLTLTFADGSQPARQTATLDLDVHLTRAETEHPDKVDPSRLAKHQVWTGSILATHTGDYQFRAYSNGGIRVWLDGKLVMDHWRQDWLPGDDQIRVHLEVGRKYTIRMENNPEQQNTLELRWKTPPPDDNTSLWSEVGAGVDYYFVYGPSIDEVIAGERLLTGRATMLPNWAFGLWQSRQRYETAQQSLGVVREFRKRKIPFVYAGADGAFTLYEDQGTTFDYEKGARSLIPIHWNENSKSVEIGARTGSFAGMLQHRTFHVVPVSKSHAAGYPFMPVLFITVEYTGAPITVRLTL